MATLERVPKRIGVLEADIACYILNAISRKDQTAPCLVEPEPFDKRRRRNVEKTFEETTKMTGAQAHSIREHLHGEVVA